MNDTAMTALIDQASAANREGWRFMQTLAEQGGDAVRPATLGPAAVVILGRYADVVLGGRLDRCEHLRPDAPVPAVWWAWEPGRLRCEPCSARDAAAVEAAEAHRCDHCGRQAPAVSSSAAFVPGAVLAEGVAVGPTRVVYGLCVGCTALRLRAPW